MLTMTWDVFKNNWKRYLWSSFVTFCTFFVLALAIVIKDLDFSSLQEAGWVGAVSVVGRFVGKAVFEAVKSLIFYIASKVKKPS